MAYVADLAGGRRMASDTRIWNKLTITYKDRDGERTVIGSWSAKDGMVTVKTPHGEKIAQIGGSTPDVLARMMLRQLATEGKA
jgi:hypothetical protein